MKISELNNYSDGMYDVEAAMYDIKNHNFEDIEDYLYTRLIANSLINGQMAQAKRQYNCSGFLMCDLIQYLNENGVDVSRGKLAYIEGK